MPSLVILDGVFGLGGWLDKADGVIQKDVDRSAKNAKRMCLALCVCTSCLILTCFGKVNEAVDVFKSFDETLQLKSTAQDIISHVKSTLGDDPWFMRALDDVAKIHPFVSGTVYVGRLYAQRDTDKLFSRGDRIQSLLQHGNGPPAQRQKSGHSLQGDERYD